MVRPLAAQIFTACTQGFQPGRERPYLLPFGFQVTPGLIQSVLCFIQVRLGDGILFFSLCRRATSWDQ